MHRSLFFMQSGSLRPLTAGTLLYTVRGDPGMTSKYYANRYFGIEKKMEVEHLLWKELKKHGKVTIDRVQGSDAPPLWVPLFYYPKRHNVRRHCAEDEDLSLLRSAPSPTSPAAENSSASSSSMTTSSVSCNESLGVEEAVDPKTVEDAESAVLRAVYATPEKDIQFYVNGLPEEFQLAGPRAFRRLREAGVLERRQTPQGTFVWVCAS